MEFYGSGTSSIELGRTSKGEYTWSCKLYFFGHDMRTIKQIIRNVIKTRAILEAHLGQSVVSNDEMSQYQKELEDEAAKCAQEAVEVKRRKTEA